MKRHPDQEHYLYLYPKVKQPHKGLSNDVAFSEKMGFLSSPSKNGLEDSSYKKSPYKFWKFQKQ